MSQTAFGMEALKEKQVSVAQDMLQAQERAQQQQEENIKEEREAAAAAEKERQKKKAAEAEEKSDAKKAEKTCKPKGAVTEKIPGTSNRLTAAWITAKELEMKKDGKVHKENLHELSGLFNINANDSNADLAKNRAKIDARLAALIKYFENEKAESTCQGDEAEAYKDAVDWAIERVKGFYDFLMVRAAQMSDAQLAAKLLAYQDVWSKAGVGATTGEASKQAAQQKRDYEFRVNLFKAYADNPHAKFKTELVPKLVNFIRRFAIDDKSTGVYEFNLDQYTAEQMLPTLRALVQEAQTDKAKYSEALSKINEYERNVNNWKAKLENQERSVQEALQNILSTDIPGLRKKLEAAK